MTAQTPNGATNMPLDIKQIRPKVYALLRMADIPIAISFPTRVRGVRVWSSGVRLRLAGGTRAGVRVRLYSPNCSEYHEQRAIETLRAAGYTVTEPGVIEAVPGGAP